MKVKRITRAVLATFAALILAISFFVITELIFSVLNTVYQNSRNAVLGWIVDESAPDRLYLVAYPLLISVYILIYVLLFRKEKDRVLPDVSWEFTKGVVNSIVLGIAFGGISTLWIEFLANTPLSDIGFIKRSLEYLNYSGGESTVLSFLITVFVAGILGPIMEELIYRGIMFRLLEKHANKWYALIVSSLIFGIVHMSFAQSVYAGIMGLIAGIVYMKTRKLGWTMLMHITINTIASFGFTSSAIWLGFTVIMFLPMGIILHGLLKTENSKSMLDANMQENNI